MIQIAGTNYSRKIRFLPYFPYGFCSKLATTIEGKDNPFATMILLGDDPDDIIKQSDKHRKKGLDRARYLCEKKYAVDTMRACGTPPQKRNFRYLKKKGLTVLMEAPDEAATEGDEDAPETSELNGIIKVDHFRSGSLASADLRELLLDLAGSDDPSDQAYFNEILLDAVKEERLTPLSCAVHLIQATKINPSKYSPNQQYSIWKQSHIQAMFLANNHLTYLDRRPYDTGFAIDGITDEESYQTYIQKYGHTMASTTYYTLNTWYKNNPGHYQITQRTPDESQEAKDTWLRTPSYYSTRELPIFDTKKQITMGTDTSGNQRVVNTIHIGLVTGKNVNYVCYHGKTGEFKWLPKREEAVKTEIEQSVHLMKTRCPEMTCKEAVDFALYFCSSRHQFLALFERTKQKHIPHKKLDYPTNKPYASMHAVPVNDSGTFQLWCLAEWTPLETESGIHESLIEMKPGLEYYPNTTYPLIYNGKRVFSGYTMDIQKINLALEDHLDGHDFYIACFSDQMPWYKILFPGKTFL